MVAPYTIIDGFINAVRVKNSEDLYSLLTKDATIIFNGKNYTSKEFVLFLIDTGYSDFSVRYLNVSTEKNSKNATFQLIRDTFENKEQVVRYCVELEFGDNEAKDQITKAIICKE